MRYIKNAVLFFFRENQFHKGKFREISTIDYFFFVYSSTSGMGSGSVAIAAITAAAAASVSSAPPTPGPALVGGVGITATRTDRLELITSMANGGPGIAHNTTA